MVLFQTYWKILHGRARLTLSVLQLLLINGLLPHGQLVHQLSNHDSWQKNQDSKVMSEIRELEFDDDLMTTILELLLDLTKTKDPSFWVQPGYQVLHRLLQRSWMAYLQVFLQHASPPFNSLCQAPSSVCLAYHHPSLLHHHQSHYCRSHLHCFHLFRVLQLIFMRFGKGVWP